MATSSEGTASAWTQDPGPPRQRFAVHIRGALVCAAAWVIIRLAFASYFGAPVPWIHDEFSYLLGADTFSHGRLTNPPHPLPAFFESPHILLRPTYCSKYLPGQALVLAAGQILFGTPFAGVVIQGAGMIFACYLMLAAWVARPWPAVIMAILIVRFQPPMYWVDSYWGGPLAAVGAALVLLAAGIVRHRGASASAGVVFGFGAVTLAYTRIYEGGVLAICVAVYVLYVARPRESLQPMIRLACAVGLVVAAGAIWLGYYNWRTTGNPVRLAYMVYDSTFSVTPPLWFMPLRPQPAYDQPHLADQHGLHGYEANQYREVRTLRDLPKRTRLQMTCITGWMLVLLLCVPLYWRCRDIRALTMILTICVLALVAGTWGSLHYAAPAGTVALLLVTLVAARLWSRRTRAVRVGAVVVCVILGAAFAHEIYKLLTLSRVSPAGIYLRPAVIQQLKSDGLRNVVFVHYTGACSLQEWVYNSADIDSQSVIFAHDLGPVADRTLVNYYHGRVFWDLWFDSCDYSAIPSLARRM